MEITTLARRIRRYRQITKLLILIQRFFLPPKDSPNAGRAFSQKISISIEAIAKKIQFPSVNAAA